MIMSSVMLSMLLLCVYQGVNSLHAFADENAVCCTDAHTNTFINCNSRVVIESRNRFIGNGLIGNRAK